MSEKTKRILKHCTVFGFAMIINLLVFKKILILKNGNWEFANYSSLIVSGVFVFLSRYESILNKQKLIKEISFDFFLILLVGILLEYVLLFLVINVYFCNKLISKIIIDFIVLLLTGVFMRLFFLDTRRDAIL